MGMVTTAKCTVIPYIFNTWFESRYIWQVVTIPMHERIKILDINVILAGYGWELPYTG